MYFIGLDLGTSALKQLLVDEKGTIVKEVSKEYPLMLPQPGWSEQDPDAWIGALYEGLDELLDGIDRSQVRGIGCGGQMHGLVVLDADDQVIRPCILWNDGRTGAETDYLNNVIGKDKISQYTGNIAFAGFTAPKILWMAKNEPENFAKIAKIMLPKDYLNYRMSGVHCTDYSDASGFLLLDVANKCYSQEMLAICGITEAQMPKLYESWETVGTVTKEFAERFGLKDDVIVCAGAGDNAAAAIGTGTVRDGDCNVSLGTSGTIFIVSDHFGVDENNGLHSFAHANGRWHQMGCMLSAASCNKWFCEEILGTKNYVDEQAAITRDKLGENRVFYLPYLMGERSPHNDVNARATFIGMNMGTSRADMLQAVYEGVAFAIRDSLEIAEKTGVKVQRSKICGGGAKSPLWCEIMANVLGLPMDIPVTEQGPGYGGAMLAMVSCGVYADVAQAADALIHVEKTIEPDPEITRKYNERYAQFVKIYPTLKALYPQLL